MSFWRSQCTKGCSAASWELFPSGDEGGRQCLPRVNKAIFKNPGADLKPDLTKGRGGLKSTQSLLSTLETGHGPESSQRKWTGVSVLYPLSLSKPCCTLWAGMCLLQQPINVPNDALHKDRILSLVFALLFMLFFSVKGSKQRGYFPPTQSGRSSLK